MKSINKYIILFFVIFGSFLFALDPSMRPRTGNEKEAFFRKQQAMLQPLTLSKSLADSSDNGAQPLPLSDEERPTPREAVVSGNQIRTLVFDYGSIGHPSRQPSMEWPIYSSQGYAFEFGPLVGAEIPVDTNGYYIHEAFKGPEGQKEVDTSVVGYDKTYYIVTDGLLSGGGVLMAETSPTNYIWGWQAVPDYGNPDHQSIPLSHKPETWNPVWNGNWPGTHKAGVASADQAIYYEMDDRFNLEFFPGFKPYRPEDVLGEEEKLTHGGLGLHVVVRAYQWSNPEASDAIFFVYEITNKSQNDYEKIVFGMFGDPHIGGSNDFSDDMAYFDNELNMVFGYDGDNKGDWGGETGWLGYAFLESPGNPYDGIDNDGDGMIDESMYDGIDNDGDWDPDLHDVGQDGLGPLDPGYPGPDFGEGDGLPTAGDPNDPTKPGEPNFETTDLDEADQIGLTSFDAYQYGASGVRYDTDMWNRMKPEVPLTDENTEIVQRADNVFLYGSGYFPLKAGDTQRFSIALLMGVDQRDLYETAKTVQTIYNNGYQFAVAPYKPKLTVVPGDGRVSLYWDDSAENSYDPLFGYDFEGYAIYRSTDPGFNECLTITNSYGVPTLHKPIAKFDLENGISGPARVGNSGVHYDLGTDNGLVHEYVDTGLINGVTYYYAVCSYDIGDTSGIHNLTPTECTKIIDQDPYTKEITLDVNTGMATPQRVSPGLQKPRMFDGALDRSRCNSGTGDIEIKFVDMINVKDGMDYEISFENTGVAGDIQLSVTDLTTIYHDTLEVISTLWLQMNKTKVANVVVHDSDGNEISPTLFRVSNAIGRIQFDDSLLNETVYVSFNYKPVFRTSYLNKEDGIPVFDGMKLYVKNDKLQRNISKSGWINSETTLSASITQESDTLYPHDYKLVWNSAYENEQTVFGQYAPFRVYDMNDTSIAPIYISPNDKGKYTIKSDIFILSEATASLDYATWRIWLNYPAARDTIMPQDGDEYRITLNRPFTAKDTISFSTLAAAYDPNAIENPMDAITVVPNPYTAQAIWEPSNGYVSGRGERRVYFTNLPPICTIKIYTISGEHVRTIEHNSGGDINQAMFDGSEAYNLLNKDNADISFGVYLWQVDATASGLGIKTGKLAVIK
ncbi:MAG: hypothetical protein WCT23_05005 [Candidatus Neomarinimicrobiota bacterium]